MKATLAVEAQSPAAKDKITTSDDITRLFAMAGTDPSSIDLAKFAGMKMPSVYEASLISPQFRDFVVWYHEAMRQKKLEASYQTYLQKQWDRAYEDFLEVKGEKHSRYLEEAVKQVDAGEKCRIGAEEFNALYEHIRSYRGDKNDAVFDTCYYCYFLVDASKLPTSERGFRDTTFRQFLDAVFYIGKGIGSRGMDHLTDAILYRLSRDPEERQRLCPALNTERFGSIVRYLKNPRKLAHILEIWSKDAGVIVFDGVLRGLCNHESCSFEASMLLAFGRDNLLNEKNASWKPPTDQWTAVQRAMLGVHVLVRAYEAFRRFVTQPTFQNDYDDYVKDYVDRKLKRRKRVQASRKRRSGAVVAPEDVIELSSSDEEGDVQDDEISFIESK
ncbi:hypothetical protein AAVH_12345 [Aphelenchoides avenae]|nr:hypothetical protein AAVH_12345 [Aphelenchus avenae]